MIPKFQGEEGSASWNKCILTRKTRNFNITNAKNTKISIVHK
nr:MAG TPA: hypothetical protein [Caudoviricetes sp.]